MKAFSVSLAMCGVALAGCTSLANDKPHDYVAGEPILLNDNAGWCWYQDPRVIVHDGKLLASTVSDDSGPGGEARMGNVELAVLDLDTQNVQRVVLHEKLEDDDHNAAALTVLPDGRYLAIYGKHNTDRLMRWRISSKPGNATDWQPEQTLDAESRYTYQNVFQLSDQPGHVYNFHRGVGFNPNYMLSTDGGKSFSYGGRLLAWNTELTNGLGGGGRPYLRYASNDVDTIHFIATEDHPRNYNNSVYHGYIRDGQIFNSTGQALAELSTTKQAQVSPTDLTRVYEGGPDNVAWTVDLELDQAGHPVALISVQHGDADVARDASAGGQDLRYYYGRFDGQKWQTHALAYAGSRLYAPEVDYSGLGAIDPGNANIVYISTDADPVTGEALISDADGQRHYEIFKGVTDDRGKSWDWTPITANSTQDNIRPSVPQWTDGTALLWLRGTFTTFRDYNTELVGLITDPSEK